eukprot:TRINITY_DN11581_c0_g1_i1.p2 TRINITY_DN11581_c0_g1~~TRINITY_DN11581_c0_g1_i1.p2  ORF type:complete len:429 (-),score=124.73 TRINITY_DN11581_c0_g1_i1:52-1338(-)
MQKQIFFSLLVAIALVACASAAPTQESLGKFAGWLQANNVQSAANIGLFEGFGLGGVARADVKEGEALVRVPTSALVSLRDVRTKVFADFTEWSNNHLEPLMVWLILESGNENSPFSAYFGILPEEFPTMPIFWTAEELQELEGTGLVGATAGTKAALEASFEHISTKLVQPNPTVFKAEAFTFERWLWAYCVCVSRSWTVVQEEQADLVLAPLADMLNHDVEASTLQYSEDGSHVLIAATRDYAKGDQLFASYGKKSNYDLLAMYGFVVEDNANDAMQINFQLNPGNLVQSIVEPLLRVADPNYKKLFIGRNTLPVTLLRLFRLNVMDFSELEFVDRALRGQAVSLANEVKAFRAAIQSLAGMLKAYPTTIEEDAALLARDDISDNVRAAVIVRKGQKEILRNNVLMIGKLWENILVSGKLFGDVAL